MRRRHLAASLACCCLIACSTASAQVARLTVTVDPGPASRQRTVISTTIPDLRPQLSRFLATLKGSDGETIRAQADQILDAEGRVVGTRITWIQPKLEANRPRTYALTIDGEPYDITKYFHYVDRDGYRDLFFGTQGVYRYVNKYDPADQANTYKPFHHIYGFHDDGFITKGPGGMETHHRGLFFGYMTPLGNFWSCRDAHQEHAGYRFESESAGPVAARTVSVVDWVDHAGNHVIRDTRDITAYRAAKDLLVLDYDVTAENLTPSDIPIQGNAHHGGFHFRAAQEVADQKPASAKAFDGGATYVLPPGAAAGKDGEWANCPWVACDFTVKGNPYTVLHMSHPSNPGMTVYSTRAYGRFGALTANETLHPGRPLRLRYRIVIADPKAHSAELTPDAIAGWYADFSAPPTVTIRKTP
jgi:hypothetical protein